MKKIIFSVLFLSGCNIVGVAYAQETSLTAIDMSAPLADARGGIAWDKMGTQLGVAYIPVIYICPGAVEWATFNLGAADKLRTGKASYLVSFGPRIDTLFSKLGATSWAKKNLRFITLPPLQINLNFLTMDFRKYTPMLSLSTRIGGR